MQGVKAAGATGTYTVVSHDCRKSGGRRRMLPGGGTIVDDGGSQLGLANRGQVIPEPGEPQLQRRLITIKR